MSEIDHRLFWALFKAFKRRYRFPKNTVMVKNHYVSMNMLGNRVARHSRYGSKTLAVKVNGVWIGLTNFEFFMNRDYAYNRDRGKCRACGCYLFVLNAHRHRIDLFLPAEQLCQVAWVAVRVRGSPFHAWFWSHQGCLGKKNAIIAVARNILYLIYRLLESTLSYDAKKAALA